MKKKELLKQIESLQEIVEKQRVEIAHINESLVRYQTKMISLPQYDEIMTAFKTVQYDYKQLWGEIMANKTLEGQNDN